MWVRGYEFHTANEFPSYWSICVAGVAGAIRRLCQLWLFVSVIRADTELSYCSSLHLLPLDEWQRAAQILRKLMSMLSRHNCESALVFRGYSSLVYSDFWMRNWGTCLYSSQEMSQRVFFFFLVFRCNYVKAFCVNVSSGVVVRQEVWFLHFPHSTF